MPRIDVKSERINGGMVISAHTKDWDLMQSFPHTIVQDICDAIVTRFLEENREAILTIVQDAELLSTALAKEVSSRVGKMIAENKKREQERMAHK